MNYICDDILIIISNFLSDKDIISFILSSKYNKNLLYKRGYLKTIKINNTNDPFVFSDKFLKHNNTLKNVYVFSLQNPQYFMNGTWPEYVCLYNCFVDKQIPINKTRTKQLVITYNLSHKLSLNFKINWNNFSGLKILFLDLNTDNIEFLNNIDICENLELLCLLLNKNFEIPSVIGKLKKIKYIITNCAINVNTIFVSKDLKHCVSKNMYNNNNFTKNNICKDRFSYLYNEKIIFSDFTKYIT